VDVLSDVLREVRLTGAVYFDVHAGAPWVASTPGSASICAAVMPDFEHVIAFHIMLDGRGWAQLAHAAQAPTCLDAGDAVIIAHGDGHAIASDPMQSGSPDVALYRRTTAESLPFVFREFGGQGAKARFVCGFLGCDARPFNPVLEALPPLLHVKRASPAGILTHDLMRIALEESGSPRAGGEAILAKISELMFLHAVRQHIDALPAESTGWLASLRDRHVSAALRAMHSNPAASWTLDSLGREVGLSRTVFAERFTAMMGISAMQYLSNWRLQRAATLLDTQRLGLAQIAADVGFGSEAAFNRAFKRQVGMPPGAWRRRKELSPVTATSIESRSAET
jgi:AraC-like DNA-binding protein